MPELSSPRIVVGISWLGLQRILHTGGSGYFPQRLIKKLLEQQQLFRIPLAPTFQLPVYVVWPATSSNVSIVPALEQLQNITELTLQD